MKSISISGSSRTEVGKKATNALRNAGLVPCCIYGVEKDEKVNKNSMATEECPTKERRNVSHRNKQGTCTASSKEQQEFPPAVCL